MTEPTLDDLDNADQEPMQPRRIHRGSPVWLLEENSGDYVGRSISDVRPFRIGEFPCATGSHEGRSAAFDPATGGGNPRVIVAGFQGGKPYVSSIDISNGVANWHHEIVTDDSGASGVASPAVAVDADGVVYVVYQVTAAPNSNINVTVLDAGGNVSVDDVTILTLASTDALEFRVVESLGELVIFVSDFGGGSSQSGLFVLRADTDGTLIYRSESPVIETLSASADVTENNEILLLLGEYNLAGFITTRKLCWLNDGVELTTRTNDTEGVITVRDGHTIETGDTIDIWWPTVADPGKRIGCDVDDVDGNEITFSGGTPFPTTTVSELPAQGTLVEISRRVELTLSENPIEIGENPELGDHICAPIGPYIWVAVRTWLYRLDLDGDELAKVDLSSYFDTGSTPVLIDAIFAPSGGNQECYVHGRNISDFASTTLLGTPLRSRLLRVLTDMTVAWDRAIMAPAGQFRAVRRDMAESRVIPIPPSSTVGGVFVVGDCWPPDRFDGMPD